MAKIEPPFCPSQAIAVVTDAIPTAVVPPVGAEEIATTGAEV